MTGKLVLFRVVAENDRAVLRPVVVALAIPSRRVVRSARRFSSSSAYEITVGSNAICTASACPVVRLQTLGISGIHGRAAAVAGNRRMHAFQLLKQNLGTPEATAGKKSSPAGTPAAAARSATLRAT